MKYLSIASVVGAYNENKNRTKNKFWGLLSILSALDSIVKPGISYNFDTSKVSTLLENLFCISDDKKLYQNASFWNVMFSRTWAAKAADLMLSETPNIYDIAVWYYRRTSFQDNVTSLGIIRMLLESLHIDESDAKELFDFHSKEIAFSQYIYDETDLLKSIGISSSNITAEGEAIVAHPGELSRAPFIQTLYAGQSLMECLIITQFQFNDLYDNKAVKDCPRTLSNDDYNQYNEIINLLLERRNIILSGAPGTGKTYTAKSIAANLISGGTSDWDKLTEEQRMQIGFVQFHPSYDYTDFVEGLRPDDDGSFSRQDGVFKTFCKRALGDEDELTHSGNNLFDKVYNDLIDDIKSGKITKYQRIYADDANLSVNDKGRIVYKTDDSHPKTESVRNMRLLFDYYVDKGHFSIDRSEREDMYKVISNLTEGKTNGLDFTEYMWTLNELLSRVKKGGLHSFATTPEEDIEQQLKKPYIFIIDEINRGELSKIFGELFYAIEPDYRGKVGTVQTQYNNLVEEGDIFKSGFYIPENVYIIGTMNDVDRGVEAMDFAIRRRFAWVEVTAEESAENMGIKDLALAKMNALNAALKDNGLSRAYYIGGAYFRKLKGDDYDFLWKYHLEGIVYEYFRGEPDAEDKLQAVKKAFDEASLPSYDTHESTESATEG